MTRPPGGGTAVPPPSPARPEASRPDRDAVCAVVVTYNCGEKVGRTLAAVAPQAGRIVVADNGSAPPTADFLAAVASGALPPVAGGEPFPPGKVEVLSLGENRGIGHALNAGVDRAAALGFEWVLTMDDDSVAAPDMVARMAAAWAAHPERERVLLLGPVYSDRETGTPGKVRRYRGMGREELDPSASAAESLPVTCLITSGNLVRVRHYLAVGGTDGELFMDFNDHDLCLRGGRAGLLVLVVPKARLFHSIGRARHAVVLGRRLTLGTGHAPYRRFYQARNLLWVVRRYGREQPRYALDMAAAFLREAAALLLFERERKGEKLRETLRGIRSGLARTIPPVPPPRPFPGGSR